MRDGEDVEFQSYYGEASPLGKGRLKCISRKKLTHLRIEQSQYLDTPILLRLGVWLLAIQRLLWLLAMLN